MEVLTLKNTTDILNENLEPIALAIGYFDGVHIGHQKVILTAKEIAKQNGWKSAVMTFDPSPKAVLGKNPEEVKYITLLEDKTKLIAALGIDYLFVVPFTKEFAGLMPQSFINDYIIQLNVRHLVAGFDFSYGKFGSGNMETIKEHSKGKFAITTIEKITVENEKISSTTIKSLIETGLVQEVPKYLGRNYSINGTVIHGEKRGRQIGFPTANLASNNKYVYPANGIYVVKMYVAGRWVNGVCSIGYNPTFNEEKNKRFVETHLIDFDQNIYGEHVVLEWHSRLRDEEKFANIDALIAQIAKDKQNAIEYFQLKD
ncbi:riboflavin biosynthesis protein RibF [Caldibacillus lycopersici]|uniref:Riboflavin biosynthesis protein n=1 Tax=Perspicuibacillus lycopersici TaxID=1325689 RepID=A0AAE3ITY2_9BACI|nr:riboflavin biosynthesis protein RibF [Perspicuibacillus lycopersici]MCU9612060.1 riboflavin biosynthesis protein RibF [Perspicuibacillus lycopersici]